MLQASRETWNKFVLQGAEKYYQCTTLTAQWSSSMIPASGIQPAYSLRKQNAGGPGFNSRLSPFFCQCVVFLVSEQLGLGRLKSYRTYLCCVLKEAERAQEPSLFGTVEE